MAKPKILILDIETAPALADVWGLWNNNVGLNMLRKNGYIMSWAAKWLHEPKIYYDDCSAHGEADEYEMLLGLVDLIWEADIIVAHNGDKFDMGWIRGRCLFYGIPPFPPVKQVDTLKTARLEFRLISNKLEHLAKLLGCEEKLKHKEFAGFELWAECLKGNKAAWKEMKAYNKQDVGTLEEVYLKMLPWIRNHPNMGVIMGEDVPVCPKCGGKHLQKRGPARTNVGVYQRYRCNDCGGWSRGRRMINDIDVRKHILVNIAG